MSVKWGVKEFAESMEPKADTSKRLIIKLIITRAMRGKERKHTLLVEGMEDAAFCGFCIRYIWKCKRIR